ncbi:MULTISPECIES: fimbrial protein [Parabacteroides]|uniref:fimbrial protein n=1 Tax=Parabacteroides leei TaxID=2939491 RepID=UPI0018992ACD|nr:fimbrial protein [Parabacteroides goldsteinii]
MRRNIIQSASLFLSFLAVVSFSACSNDDGSGIEVPKEPVDAYLSIAATPETLTRSVKSTDEVSFDKYINTLTALVFTEGGDFYTQKTVSSNDDKSVSEITDISVKVLPNYENPEAGSSTKFQVVLIANGGTAIENNSIKNIADLSTKITTPSIEGLGEGDGKSYLPMSSAILTVTGLKYSGDENWIDGNNEKVKYDKEQATAVSLTRLVSQVKLHSVAVNFSSDFYKDANFIIDEVYLVNVRKNAYFLPSSINKDAQEGVGESEGESYENSTSDFFRGGPETFTTEDGLIANNENNSTYNKLYKLSLSEDNILADNGQITTPFDGFTPYVYPSVVRGGEYQTRLVLSCRYRFQNALEYTQKYFHIVIGNKGELVESATQAYSGIVANSVYTIDVTITGEGSPTPDKYVPTAELTVNMTVEPWYVEHQKEED